MFIEYELTQPKFILVSIGTTCFRLLIVLQLDGVVNNSITFYKIFEIKKFSKVALKLG